MDTIGAALAQGRLRSARRQEIITQRVLLPWVRSQGWNMNVVPAAILGTVLGFVGAWEEHGPHSDTVELLKFHGLQKGARSHELQAQRKAFNAKWLENNQHLANRWAWANQFFRS